MSGGDEKVAGRKGKMLFSDRIEVVFSPLHVGGAGIGRSPVLDCFLRCGRNWPSLSPERGCSVNAALGRPLEVHQTVLNSLPKYVQPSSQRSPLAVSGATRRDAPLLPVTSEKTIIEVPLPLRFETQRPFLFVLQAWEHAAPGLVEALREESFMR
jgi:hypothetical protein